jgi:hypothetical protein
MEGNMAETKKTEKPVKAGRDIVSVFLPKESANANSLFVSINGKGYNIPRGKSIRVPRSVAEVLARRERAIKIEEDYLEKQVAMSNVIQGI